MTSKKLLQLWVNYLFEPNSPIPIALFRIFLGILILQMALVHIGTNVLQWYGPKAVTSFDSVKNYYWLNAPHFDLFLLVPRTDSGALALWYIFVTAALCLTLGLFSRVVSVIVCMCLISIHNHQPFNLNGGDTMLRLYSGYLMFSDCGAALSIDRLIQRYKHPTFAVASQPSLIAPWGQRMIQIQLAIAYWSTFCHKISGKQWLDGTAVYYATRLDDMMRFPLPLLYDNVIICKLLTWFTLVIEGSMFTLIWLKDIRYYVLLGAVLMHLGIDLAINLPVFEYAFIIGFITFVAPEDLTKVMDYMKTRVAIGFGAPSALYYDPQIPKQKSIASTIEGLDVLGRLNITERETSLLIAETPAGELHGLKLFAWLTCRLPLLWVLYPFFGLPFQLVSKKN